MTSANQADGKSQGKYVIVTAGANISVDEIVSSTNLSNVQLRYDNIYLFKYSSNDLPYENIVKSLSEIFRKTAIDELHCNDSYLTLKITYVNCAKIETSVNLSIGIGYSLVLYNFLTRIEVNSSYNFPLTINPSKITDEFNAWLIGPIFTKDLTTTLYAKYKAENLGDFNYFHSNNATVWIE